MDNRFVSFSAADSSAAVSPANLSFPPSEGSANDFDETYSSSNFSLPNQPASAPPGGFAISDALLPALVGDSVRPSFASAPVISVASCQSRNPANTGASQLDSSFISGSSSSHPVISIPFGVEISIPSLPDAPWSFRGPRNLISPLLTSFVSLQFSVSSFGSVGPTSLNGVFELLVIPGDIWPVNFSIDLPAAPTTRSFRQLGSAPSDLPPAHVSSIGRLPSSGEESTAPTQLDPPMHSSPPLVSAHKRRENSSRSGPPVLAQLSAGILRSRRAQLRLLNRLPPRLHPFLSTLVDGAVRPCGRRPRRLLGLSLTLRE